MSPCNDHSYVSTPPTRLIASNTSLLLAWCLYDITSSPSPSPHSRQLSCLAMLSPLHYIIVSFQEAIICRGGRSQGSMLRDFPYLHEMSLRLISPHLRIPKKYTGCHREYIVQNISNFPSWESPLHYMYRPYDTNNIIITIHIFSL